MTTTAEHLRNSLDGRFLALIFEKPSLRTRVSFEVGIGSLGGTAVFLDHTLTHLGERESVRDISKNLERWVHGIVARVFTQESLNELAANANIPVINVLSDKFHPCQALADFFTLEEHFASPAFLDGPGQGMRQQARQPESPIAGVPPPEPVIAASYAGFPQPIATLLAGHAERLLGL